MLKRVRFFTYLLQYWWRISELSIITPLLYDNVEQGNQCLL